MAIRRQNGQWYNTGCGCSGSKATGPPIQGIVDSQLLIWNLPAASVVVAVSDGSRYTVQGSQLLLDLTTLAYNEFSTDSRFRIPTEPEKNTLFGYMGRML